MPIERQPGEEENAFISRCISEEVGKGHEQDQAYVICKAYLNMAEIKRLKSLVKKITRN